MYLAGADREKLDPILDACVATYNEELDEDGQVEFKGKAKAFVRTYGFLSSILPYTNAEWEKLSIFLNFLIPKLPAPKEEDLSRGILETIDMDSYRRRDAGRPWRSLCPIRRRDRAGADGRWRGQAPSRNGPTVQHPQGLQRSVWEHPLDGYRQDPQADRGGYPRKVAADKAYQNASRTPTSRMPGSSTTRRWAA